MIEIFAIVISVNAIIIACVAYHKANEISIELKAMQKSTHSIQYVPAEELLKQDEIQRMRNREQFAEADDNLDAPHSFEMLTDDDYSPPRKAGDNKHDAELKQ